MQVVNDLSLEDVHPVYVSHSRPSCFIELHAMHGVQVANRGEMFEFLRRREFVEMLPTI